MTTSTLFGVAGPFTVGAPLSFSAETNLVDKVSGLALVLPAGHICTEVQVQLRGTTNADFLTTGKAIAVGIAGDVRKFTGSPGVLTDDLNADAETGQVVKIDPTTTANGLMRAETTAKNYVIQCGLGASVIAGSVAVVVKHKPFSKSVALRH